MGIEAVGDPQQADAMMAEVAAVQARMDAVVAQLRDAGGAGALDPQLLTALWREVHALPFWWFSIREIERDSATPRAIEAPGLGPAILVASSPDRVRAADAHLGVPEEQTRAAAMPWSGAVDFLAGFRDRGIEHFVFDFPLLPMAGRVADLVAMRERLQAE